MSRPLSFRHVETIYAVLLTGSVTGGAARLHVTQPAVSNLLREAEERLEFPLFERHAGRLMPTRRAELIFAEIERSFTGLDSINEFCSRLCRGERRKIIVASTPAFASAVLPQAVKTYREDIADLHFSIVSRGSDHVQALVASQKADIGFALEEPAIPGVRSELLVAARLLCLLPGGHPLTEKTMISVGDLVSEPMISLSRSERVDDIIETAFSEFGGPPIAVAECPAAIAACAMVEAGIGFAILDPISAHLFRNSSIVFRTFMPELYLNLWAYWVPGRQSAFEQENFIRLVHDIAGEILESALSQG
ncbi:DNA-binding transcriptional LysR family regulator [Paraburkholderia sp. EB58]|uniref:LysR substrate-binding domain-containing protein n=1 Tax=Paraburkholderia sp. EB58 TaxID=3035125 RepID=UPI003D23B9CC